MYTSLILVAQTWQRATRRLPLAESSTQYSWGQLCHCCWYHPEIPTDLGVVLHQWDHLGMTREPGVGE